MFGHESPEDYANKLKKLKGYEQNEYLRNVVLKELTHPFQLGDLVRWLLWKTTKESNWDLALRICKEANDHNPWMEFTHNLKRLADKSNQPSWMYSIVEGYARRVKVGHGLNNVASIFVRTGWPQLYLEHIFPKHEEEDSYRAISSIIAQVSPAALMNFVRTFNDWEFITQLFYDKINNIQKQAVITQALRLVESSKLKNFDFFEFEWFIKKNPELFTHVDVINSAMAAHRVKRAGTTTTLLVDLIMNGPFTEESKNNWLLGMYKVELADKNVELNMALYELTDDIKYLPEEAKDIFFI